MQWGGGVGKINFVLGMKPIILLLSWRPVPGCRLLPPSALPTDTPDTAEQASLDHGIWIKESCVT